MIGQTIGHSSVIRQTIGHGSWLFSHYCLGSVRAREGGTSRAKREPSFPVAEHARRRMLPLSLVVAGLADAQTALLNVVDLTVPAPPAPGKKPVDPRSIFLKVTGLASPIQSTLQRIPEPLFGQRS